MKLFASFSNLKNIIKNINKNIIYYGIDVYDANFLEKYCKT